MQIPDYVKTLLDTLKNRGYDAYIVGGCVRDTFLEKVPRDWDITTNALPEEIQKIFPHTLYNNRYGTVVVSSGRDEVEITPFRKEAQYTDKRHPDKVVFGKTLEEDVVRRDFTVNALASDGGEIMDLVGGKKDLQARRICTVGNPEERFEEDALRLLRAIRFSAELDFQIEEKTWQALQKKKDLITHISPERIRDELLKILASDNAFRGFWLLRESGLIHFIFPEAEAGYGVLQNKHHIYTIFSHLMLSLQYCPSEDPVVRLAAFLHDVGKPQTKRGVYPNTTFYGHEIVGARMTIAIMRRLKFSRHDTERAAHLVRQHMFYSDTDIISDAGVRRLLRRVGKENMEDLLAVRVADRMGSGCQIEKPRRLLELEERMVRVQKDPIDTRLLVIDGNDIMNALRWKPNSKIGLLLNMLLDEVIEDPKKNNEAYLKNRALEAAKDFENVSDEEARKMAKQFSERWSGKFVEDWEAGKKI